jgi:hypothetical protein
MNKALLLRLFPEAGGKWYFTRMQLDQLLPTAPLSGIEIKLEANFDFQLTKSGIVSGGVRLGSIFYTLVR